MTTNNLNRHELISHFYKPAGADGELRNEQGQTLLEALQFDSYEKFLIWFSQEALIKDLDWNFDKLAAGSPYVTSMPKVVEFCEEKTGKSLLKAFLQNLESYSQEAKRFLHLNLPRIYRRLENLYRNEGRRAYFRLRDELKEVQKSEIKPIGSEVWRLRKEKADQAHNFDLVNRDYLSAFFQGRVREIEKLAKQGKISCYKVRGRLHYDRQEIKELLK